MIQSHLPPHLLQTLEQHAARNHLNSLHLILVELPLPYVLQILYSTQITPNLEFYSLSHLCHRLREPAILQDQSLYELFFSFIFLQNIFSGAFESKSQQVRCQYYHLAAIMTKFQSSSLQRLDFTICRLFQQMNYDNYLLKNCMETCSQMIHQFQAPPYHLNERIFKQKFLNHILRVALNTFNQAFTYEEEYEAYSFVGDQGIMKTTIQLVIDITNFDFGYIKRHSQENEYVMERSPLLIPSKVSKAADYSEFSQLKDRQMLKKLAQLFSFCETGDMRALIIQLLGDFSRIHLRFFGDKKLYISYMASVNQLMQAILQILYLNTDTDYQRVMVFSASLLKTLSNGTLRQFDMQILFHLIQTVCGFLEIQMKSLMLSPKLLKPFFNYLIEVKKALEPAQCGAQSSLLNIIEETKNIYRDCLMKCVDSWDTLFPGRNCANQIRVSQLWLQMNTNPLDDPDLLMPDYLYLFRAYFSYQDYQAEGTRDSIFCFQKYRLWKCCDKPGLQKGENAKYAIIQSLGEVCELDHHTRVTNLYIYSLNQLLELPSHLLLEAILELEMPLQSIVIKIIEEKMETHRFLINKCISILREGKFQRDQLQSLLLFNMDKYANLDGLFAEYLKMYFQTSPRETDLVRYFCKIDSRNQPVTRSILIVMLNLVQNRGLVHLYRPICCWIVDKHCEKLLYEPIRHIYRGEPVDLNIIEEITQILSLLLQDAQRCAADCTNKQALFLFGSQILYYIVPILGRLSDLDQNLLKKNKIYSCLIRSATFLLGWHIDLQKLPNIQERLSFFCQSLINLLNLQKVPHLTLDSDVPYNLSSDFVSYLRNLLISKQKYFKSYIRYDWETLYAQAILSRLPQTLGIIRTVFQSAEGQFFCVEIQKQIIDHIVSICIDSQRLQFWQNLHLICRNRGQYIETLCESESNFRDLLLWLRSCPYFIWNEVQLYLQAA